MTTAPVTLTEVLQLRENGGLINDEILAVLKLGSQSLSTLIESAKISSVQNMGFSMDSVYFLSEGSVLLKPLPFEILNETFIPPECLLDEKPEKLTSRNLDKMYIFSFGAVLIFALEYGNKGVVMSTPEVYSLLNLMTIRDPTVRLNLEKVAQMTERLVQANKVDTTRVIQKLFDSIVENGGEDKIELSTDEKIASNVEESLSSDEINHLPDIIARLENSSDSRESPFTDQIKDVFDGDKDYLINAQEFPVKILRYSDNNAVTNSQTLCLPPMPKAPICDIIVEKFLVEMIESIPIDGTFNFENITSNEHRESSSEDKEIAYGILNHDNLPENIRIESNSLQRKEISSLDLSNVAELIGIPSTVVSHLDYSLAEESDDNDEDNASFNGRTGVKIIVPYFETYSPVTINSLEKNDGDFLDENVSYPETNYLIDEKHDSSALKRASLTERGKDDNNYSSDHLSRWHVHSNRNLWSNFDDLNNDQQYCSSFPAEKEEVKSCWFSTIPISSKPPFEISVSNKHLDMPENDKLSVNVVDGSVILPFDTDFDTYLNNKNDAFAADFTENRTTNETRSTKSAGILQKLMPMSPDDFFQLKSHGELVHVRRHHSQRCYLCSPRKSAKNAKRRSLPNSRPEPGSLASFETLFRSRSFIKSTVQCSLRKHDKSMSPIDSSQINLDLTLNSLKKKNDLFASFDKLATSSESPSPTNSDWYNIENPKEDILSKNFAKQIYHTSNSYQISECFDKNNPFLESESSSSSSEDDREKLSINSEESRLKPIIECENEHDDLENSNRRSTKKLPIMVEKIREHQLQQRYDKQGDLNSKSRIEEPFPVDYLANADPVIVISTDDGPGRLSRGNSMRIKGGSIRRNISTRQHKNVSLAGTQGGRDTTDVGSNISIDVHQNPVVKVSNIHFPVRLLPGGMHEAKMVSTGPEFLFNSRQPSIRLKAPASQKPKKLFRHLLEKNVLVILLNGQRVDVSCRTDSTAENIFESVSVHTNLNERHFFGLTVLKDGEHFFLEPEQRLEKFCPPGWRSHNRHILNARILFTLYLRVKYYPVTLDFVKTEQTLHHIYLQLRRDILDERLQCQRSAACQLAAIALQAEYGDKRDTMEYFMLSHYMPDRHMLSEIGNDDMLRREISDLWVKYAGVTIREAEMEYVKLCQTLREYGIHFHRLYRNKPSSLLTPSPLGDPDTGTQLWIGIMPRGVIVFEEQDGNRVPISQHPWHTTDTLQFDHKKFVICPHSDGSLEPPKFIYYTDDYKKSMYFVNFAAGQHRFCMKMRTWAATLPMDQSSLSRRKENGTKREPNDRKKESVPSNSTDFVPIDNSEKELPVPKMRHRERGVDTQVNNQTKPMNGLLKSNSARKMSPSMSIAQPVVDMSIVSPTNNALEFLNHDESISVSLNQRLEEATQSPVGANSSSDYETFNITLFKDPHFGLGLTLVDGEIEKIEGIYVRSITPGGPAHLEGRLRVADRVTSINGVSLEGKSRHDAVDLVRQSASQVHMGILRLRFVYSSSESIEQSQQHPNDNNINKNSNNDGLDAGDLDNKKRRFEKSPNISNNRKRLDQLSPPSKSPPISSVDLLNNKGSNGIITNNQPAQNSMVWLNDTSTGGGVSFYSRTLSALDESSRMYSGLGGEESDDSVVSDDNDNEIATKKNKNETSSNNDNRKPTPVMRKYVRASKSSLGVNNNDQRRQVKSKMENELLDRSSTSSGSNLDLRQQQKNSNKSRSLSNLIIDQEKLPKSNNKDWTEDVALSKYYSQSNGFNLICISLPKNENGSLGIQVAGGKGQKKVYVKALVAEPALSCKQIQTGDQLASVNEISTRNMNHHEVVELLRNAESPVHLGLLRQKDIKTREVKEEHLAETIDVMLEKPTSGSLGLSLARPPNSEGIYIRVISAGSVAATDGRLKVGDRLWMINGDSVASCSPAEVVEKLKAAQGFVKLVLKREAKDSFVNSADLRA